MDDRVERIEEDGEITVTWNAGVMIGLDHVLTILPSGVGMRDQAVLTLAVAPKLMGDQFTMSVPVPSALVLREVADAFNIAAENWEEAMEQEEHLRQQRP